MLDAKTWSAIEELQNENARIKAALAKKDATIARLQERIYREELEIKKLKFAELKKKWR